VSNLSGHPCPSTSPAATQRLAAFLAPLLIALATLGLLASPAAANTAVTSNITTNTTWTKAGSPYDLDANIFVTKGVTLTIESGVTVDFNTGDSLGVSGTIKAIGTASEPISFTSHEALEGLGEPGQFWGVRVASENAASRFSHATFKYGGYGSTYTYAVLKVASGSTITVDHSAFEHNQQSGVFLESNAAGADISYSTFVNNSNGVMVGGGHLNLAHSTIMENRRTGVQMALLSETTPGSFLTYNTIADNARFGVTVSQSCTMPLASFAHGEYNNIYANGEGEEIGHQLSGSSSCRSVPVDWRNNYWGSDVYYYYNDPACTGTKTPFLGHLAYTWSETKHSYEVPKGPIASSTSFYYEPYVFECGWDVFAIGRNEFLTSPVEGAPEPPPPALYGDGNEAAPNFCPACNGDPVNSVTGNFFENRTDLRIPGLGGGLTFKRTYNAQEAAEGKTGPLGYGWSYEYGEKLELDPSETAATITNADGATATFTEVEGEWTAPAWVQATLVKNKDGSFTYTLPDRRVFKFSSEGKLLSITDRNGNETTLSYTEGKLTSVTDPSGRELTFAYNPAGKIKSVTDPMGRKASFSYDEAGNLNSVADPGEVSEGYGYNASHDMTSMEGPRGGTTTNVFDTNNRVTSQTDPMKHETTWVYGEGETTVTLPTGAVTKTKFAKNLPTEITNAYGTAEAATTKYEYDEELNPIKVTDPDGHATEYGYDAEGNKTSKTDALGHETRWSFNGAHQLTSITTPRGEKTTIERDTHGNPTSISRPGPGETTQTTSFKYKTNGELESLTDALGHVWSYGYDSHGDRTEETDPEGDKTTHSFDEDSRLVSTVAPRGNVEGAKASEYETTIERDARGRPLKVTDPLGHVTEFGWDANGNLTSKTDARGQTTKFVYNADDERTKAEKPNGAVLETGYDAAGRVTSQTDANNHKTEYVRNLLERAVETIDPLKRTTSEEFDAAGNLKSLTDPAERTTSYTYDAANRLTKVSYSDGLTPTAEFSYDADGNVTGMSDGTGESSFSYDTLGRLSEATDGHGSTVGYEYDLGEEQTGIAYPNGKSVSRSFDKAGRLESVTDWLGHTTSFAYSPDSQLASIAFPEGSGNVDEYAFDRADQMSGATMSRGAETLASLSYARDKVGEIESLTSTGLPGTAEEAFTYDENNRLTKAGTSSFGYDAADNLTSAPGTTNTYDAASQLKSGTGVSYSYDELGERTKATPTSGPATSYSYNQAGELTAVERPAEGEVPAIAETPAYDGSGLLASKTSGETTRYLTWDQTAGLQLLLDDGERSYVYGPGGLPVEQIEGEAVTYLHHDQLGSTRMLTNASGEAVGKFSYTPYGALEASTGTATTPLGFAGQYTDSQTGLQYDRARFYDPATGQFLSSDPLEAVTGQPYSYGGDNPLNLIDPSGLSCSGLIPNPIDCASEAVEEVGSAIDTAGEVAGDVGELASEAAGVAKEGVDFVVEHRDVIVPVVVTSVCVVQAEACPVVIGISAAITTGENINHALSEPCFDFWGNEAKGLLVTGAAALPGGVFDAAAGRIATDVGLTAVRRRAIQATLDAPGTGLEIVHAGAQRNR
jgi:RHS repeat-associated protein